MNAGAARWLSLRSCRGPRAFGRSCSHVHRRGARWRQLGWPTSIFAVRWTANGNALVGLTWRAMFASVLLELALSGNAPKTPAQLCSRNNLRLKKPQWRPALGLTTSLRRPNARPTSSSNEPGQFLRQGSSERSRRIGCGSLPVEYLTEGARTS